MENGMSAFMAFVPMLILMLPFTIGVWWLAPKMGVNRPLWVVLMLIPIINIIVVYIFFFVIIGTVFDKLNNIDGKLAQTGTESPKT